MHTHTLRHYFAGALGLCGAVILLGWAYAPPQQDFESAPVVGRVTYADHPFSGMIYFLAEDQRYPDANGPLDSDGSFRLYMNGLRQCPGAALGTYRVIIRPDNADEFGSRVDPKYQDSRTSDLLVQVLPGSNDFEFSLPDPGRVPTLVLNR
jgi:hypothetical protein